MYPRPRPPLAPLARLGRVHTRRRMFSFDKAARARARLSLRPFFRSPPVSPGARAGSSYIAYFSNAPGPVAKRPPDARFTFIFFLMSR